MDLNGRLMALKPDVTLSVIKNVAAGKPDGFERLYYIEPIYRLAKENHAFREINQIGMELIGETGSYANMEAVLLAAESLRLIDANFYLEISHLGFISGLLEGMRLEHGMQQQVLQYLHNKNTHDLTRLLGQTQLSETEKNKLAALPGLYGSFRDTLQKAKELVISQTMAEALEELAGLYQVLEDSGCAGQVGLDFSVVNDLDYYNGLIYRGFIEGISRPVLTGGRYDRLMKKLGKDKGAIGFAVSMNELNTRFKTYEPFDTDDLILYCEGEDYSALMRNAAELRAQGRRVRVEKEGFCGSVACQRRLRFQNGILKEEKENA